MEELDGLRLTIAIALARAKPADVSTSDYCDSLRSQLSRVGSNSRSTPIASGTDLPGASSSTPLQDTSHVARLEAQIRDLQQQLEQAQSEVDQHRLSAKTQQAASHPASSSDVLPSSGEKSGKHKASEPLEEPTAPKKKRKKKQPTSHEATEPSSVSFINDGGPQSQIAFETLLGEIAQDLSIPPLHSSLSVLSSLESFLRSGQKLTTADPPVPTASRLHSHLRRSISHVAGLLASLLGIPAPPHARALSSLPQHSNARRKVRASGLLLRRLLALGNCWDHSEPDNEPDNIASLIAQVSDEIIIPTISQFYVLSRAHAERAFGITLDPTAKSRPKSLPEEGPYDDLRPECLALLVGLLHPTAQPTPPAPPAVSSDPSTSTRRDSSNTFPIPLSGTTAASTQNSDAPSLTSASSHTSAARSLWFGDIIVYLASAEIMRLVNHPLPPPPDPSASVKARNAADDKFEVLRMVREETIWYLCALVHACAEARTRQQSAPGLTTNQKKKTWSEPGPQSSAEVMRGARTILMQPLLSSRADEAESVMLTPYDGRGLGIWEKELITGAVDALNACCGEESWEADDDVDDMAMDWEVDADATE